MEKKEETENTTEKSKEKKMIVQSPERGDDDFTLGERQAGADEWQECESCT